MGEMWPHVYFVGRRWHMSRYEGVQYRMKVVLVFGIDWNYDKVGESWV
jgi:hypothetical protein